ncbi:MAG TPA: GNAT family N-acetyltransferase [Mycobacteriales bacterium]|nr:GNAT family N-acetyltransferase [Mycobacteriales bacterium]
MQEVLAAVADRWRRLDPLLPSPRPWAPEVPVLAVPGAVGVPNHRVPEPGAPLPMWFAAHGFTLRPLVADLEVGPALDRLLTDWSAGIAEPAAAAGADSAAYVFVPSRDTDTFLPLARHGLTAYVVIAARRPGYPNLPVGPAKVRQATPADLDTVAALALTQARHETPFATTYERPTAAEQIRAEADRALQTPERWVWLAEVDGAAVGLLIGTPPAQNEWLASYTDARPVAYVAVAWVDPVARSAGVGAALAAAAHQAFDNAGIGLTLLHYSMVNPRSVPFWHRLGYRPLWTGWQARPATRLS